MTDTERERALKLLAIARDTTKPLKARQSAANEVARIKVKLAAKPRPVADTAAVPVPRPWSGEERWSAGHNLDQAGLHNDRDGVMKWRAEFVRRGLPIPDYFHRGQFDEELVPSRPDREAPLPVFDEPPIRNRKLTYPRKGRAVECNEAWDTWN
jgi:hypothetical protein